jgi:zinc transport system substrate-binding protein
LWLDPVLVKEFTTAVSDALGGIDPAHADEYNRRREALAAELDGLDREYRETLGNAPNKAFVCFHAAFTYPAARYGLEQAVVMEGNLDDFGVRQLEKVITFIRERKVKVIFAEPQQPAERLQTIAKQTGARIGWLDPQGNPGQAGRDSYAALMRYNLEQMKAALNE